MTSIPLITLRALVVGSPDPIASQKTVIVIRCSKHTGVVQEGRQRIDSTLILRANSESEAKAWRNTLVAAVKALPETHGLMAVPTKQGRRKKGGIITRAKDLARTQSEKKANAGETIDEHGHVIHSKLQRRANKALTGSGGGALLLKKKKRDLMHDVVYRSEVVTAVVAATTTAASGGSSATWLPFVLPIAQAHHTPHVGSGILHMHTPIVIEIWSKGGGTLFGKRIAQTKRTSLAKLRQTLTEAHSGSDRAVAGSVRIGEGDRETPLIVARRAVLHEARPPRSMRGGFFGFFSFQFAATSLPRMDRFSDSDGYLRLAIEPPGRAPIVMWASEVVRSCKSPTWRMHKVPLRDFCWGLIDAPISISVWDCDEIGADDRIGVVERVHTKTAGAARLTLRDLMKCADEPLSQRTLPFVLDADAEEERKKVDGGRPMLVVQSFGFYEHSAEAMGARRNWRSVRSAVSVISKLGKRAVKAAARPGSEVKDKGEGVAGVRRGTVSIRVEHFESLSPQGTERARRRGSQDVSHDEHAPEILAAPPAHPTKTASISNSAALLDDDEREPDGSTRINADTLAMRIAEDERSTVCGTLTLHVHAAVGLLKRHAPTTASALLHTQLPRTEVAVRATVTHGRVDSIGGRDGIAVLTQSMATKTVPFIAEGAQPSWFGDDDTLRFLIHDTERAILRLELLHCDVTVGFVELSVDAISMHGRPRVEIDRTAVVLNTWDRCDGADGGHAPAAALLHGQVRACIALRSFSHVFSHSLTHTIRAHDSPPTPPSPRATASPAPAAAAQHLHRVGCHTCTRRAVRSASCVVP